LEDVEFSNPVYRQIYETWRDGVTRGENMNTVFFLHHESDAIRKAVTDLMTTRYDISQHWGDKYKIFIPKEQDVLNEMALGNVLRLKFRVVQKMMEDNLGEIKKAETSGDWNQLDEKLTMQEGLKQAERELAGLLGIVVAK